MFFITACLYASAGFGGGSTYAALLILSGADFRIIPILALACNIIVVTGGVWRFHKAGSLYIKAVLPFLITSVPSAWFAGRISLSETLFMALLGLVLLLAGLRMLAQRSVLTNNDIRPMSKWVAALIGTVLGGTAGLVGIGGGIFLAPLLYTLRWAEPKKIASTCSLFILVNSLAGLTGQISKIEISETISLAQPYTPLILAVFIGGQIGSWMGATRLPNIWIKRLTSYLILLVSLRLIFASIFMTI